MKEHYIQYPEKKVQLMFQDKAGFGRINKSKYCWCEKGLRPEIPSHHIRGYRSAYGAVEPLTGDSFFLVMPYCNTVCMNVFFERLSKEYTDDDIILVCDGAPWHKFTSMIVPTNITILNIPPYTPEMNPIEQIWRELRTRGFKNEVFQSLAKVVDCLCETINNLTKEAVSRITLRGWMVAGFI